MNLSLLLLSRVLGREDLETLNVPKDIDSFGDREMQDCDVITKTEKNENLKGIGGRER